MKLLLLSFALLGITLIDVTRAEKREVGKEEDKNIHIQSDSSTCECTEIGECLRCNENGCNQVASCNGKRDATVNKRINATERMIRIFKTEFSTKFDINCKCMKDGYCERLADGQWNKVKNCNGEKKYAYCDANQCLGVSDGSCSCFDGACWKCNDNGCKLTLSCEGKASPTPKPTGCQLCDHNGCTEVSCLPQCEDESGDALVNEKCSRLKTSEQKIISVICGDSYCKKVSNCKRFATCKCDMVNDTYRRCYGYKNGTHSCRTLDACSNVVSDITKASGQKLGRDTCECPSNFGLCRQCNFLGKCSYVKECEIETEIETVAPPVDINAVAMARFKDENTYDCKCYKIGHCEQRIDGHWHTVNNCSGVAKYAYCDLHHCWPAWLNKCQCHNGACVECYDNGCKLTESCKGAASVLPQTSECQSCGPNGCKTVPCLPQCIDDSKDVLVNEKCWCVKSPNVTCSICGENSCKDVPNCDRFATCTCDKIEDSYQRCYGYKHGTHYCRTLDTCSNVVVPIDVKDVAMKRFKDDNAYDDCKCYKIGHCEQRIDGHWHTVNNCSGVAKYAYCDLHSCFPAWLNKCQCHYGSCMQCDGNGCKLTASCKGWPSVSQTSDCQLSGPHGFETVPCLPQCIDDSKDVLVNEKCYCEKGPNVTCSICGENSCKDVPNCDRFATCTCDKIEDSYRRCYGYKHGTHYCRTLDTCSNVLSQLEKQT